MLVRVLGPLEVRSRGGSRFVPTGHKQRLLLAMLVIRAPQPVSTERLIDALWGASPPGTPSASLRSQVARLRAFLGRAGLADRLRLQPPEAYALDLAPHEWDAGVLAECHRLARTSPSAARRIELAEQADALWRGEPFAELRDEVDVMAEAARLEELRTALEEQRIEDLLAIGRTPEALVATDRLMLADPLRERPRALAMRALHGCGRRHEALALFQEFRRLLAEELGIDPSPGLRALEADILRGDGPAVVTSAAPTARHVPPAAPAGAAPTASLQSRRRRPLPLALASLVGRVADQAAVRHMLGMHRLVTLTGPGGCGKTRLALEIARARPSDVYWTELGALTDPAFIAPAIAGALDLRDHTGRSQGDALIEALRSRPGTLVLDNCEHLLGACVALLELLLRECPDLQVLATSREPLGLGGEVLWVVQPLSLPSTDTTDVEALLQSEAMRLLCDRTRAARPGFSLTGQNAAAMVAICRQLDGLPLALELAAARLSHLSPRELAERLESDMGVLEGGTRARLPRHQTLRAAIDWSCRLLSTEERNVLERLTVFAGDTDLEAIEAVVPDGGTVTSRRVVHVIGELVDKSLVVAGLEAAPTRYRLLETVRAHLREHRAVHDGYEAAAARHARLFAERAERAAPLLLSARRAETGRRLDADRENLRAALSWALGPTGSPEVACRLVGSLWWFWHYVGRFAEAQHWALAVLGLDLSGLDAGLQARVHYTAAMASWLLGDPARACTHADEGVRFARQTADPSLLVRAISAHAFAIRDMGDVLQARELAGQCVGIARAAGFPPADMGFALWIHCTALLESGDVPSAEVAAREAESLWRATGDRWGLSMVLHGMGMAEVGRNDLDTAAARFREAIALLGNDDEPYFVARSIEGLAIVRAHQGHAELASRLFGAAERLRASIGTPLLPFEQARYRRTVDILVPDWAGRVNDAAWAEGSRMRLDEAVALSLAPAAASGPERGP